ncbi:MAG TPA: hypothetical protein VGH40_17165 [Roseiarcus sp.]
MEAAAMETATMETATMETATMETATVETAAVATAAVEVRRRRGGRAGRGHSEPYRGKHTRSLTCER